MLLGWDENLAAKVSTLLLGSELVLPVHAGSAGCDHRAHELVGVQWATKASLCVSNDGNQPVLNRGDTLGELDLVCAHERVVDAAHNGGNRVSGVERLVWVGLPGEVGVRCNLPSGQVDCLKPSLDLLHGLVSGQCTERVGVLAGLGLLGELVPELVSAAASERLLLNNGSLELDHIGSGVLTGSARPAVVGCPVKLKCLCAASWSGLLDHGLLL